jgi:hypothetical protein
MRARSRNAARRLACFLDAIGIQPALTGNGYRSDYHALLAQYTALPPFVRKEARREGRVIIREMGLQGATEALFHPAAPAPRHISNKTARAQEMAALFAQSAGRCPSCKSFGRAKRSWPSRQIAEAFLPFSGDLSLEVYECASHTGSYHLGHRRSASDEVFATRQPHSDS